ncbi:MAG: flagellar hook-associated protein 3 [Gammaproteobacteria bacterium]|nr:MAG: flagellar hook-associated protein 3 [Gammaproteobacteria bacterium]
MQRIATPFLFAQGVDVMLKKQVDISRTELQLASGNRILRPSDDAAASVQLLDLKESKARLEQFQRNAEAVSARLRQEETALEGIGNLLQRVRELTVQGNNGSLSADDRQAIGAEIRQHLEGFIQLANTRDANGEYIFAGYRTDTPPLTHDGVGGFTYNGDEGQRVVKVGETREIAMGDPGTIFMNLPGVAGTTDIGAVIYRIAANFAAGTPDADGLTDLDTALGRILNTRASVGARMNAIDEQKTANESFALAVEQVRSNLEDLDYAEAVSRFNQQLAALQASQQSFMKIQGLNLFDFLR